MEDQGEQAPLESKGQLKSQFVEITRLHLVLGALHTL
jgi:hypothetical protein